MKVRVYPYKQGSRSAKALAEEVGGKVLRHVGSKYRPRPGDVVINWGSGAIPAFGPATVLNSGDAVSRAANKLTAFRALEEGQVSVPAFTTDRELAEVWIKEGQVVVCRQKLTGHSGDGIVIAETVDDLVRAPLYTKYIKKQDEYRVHATKDGYFFIQRKARRLDEENPDWRVRNLANGFVFIEADPDGVPDVVLDEARHAIRALGLDFGGVDVIYNQREGKAYVLEVNTACGLEERTARRYAETLVPRVAGR